MIATSLLVNGPFANFSCRGQTCERELSENNSVSKKSKESLLKLPLYSAFLLGSKSRSLFETEFLRDILFSSSHQLKNENSKYLKPHQVLLRLCKRLFNSMKIKVGFRMTTFVQILNKNLEEICTWKMNKTEQ